MSFENVVVIYFSTCSWLWEGAWKIKISKRWPVLAVEGFKKYPPLREKGAEGTLVSFAPKDETLQNAKNPKNIARLTLIDAQAS